MKMKRILHVNVNWGGGSQHIEGISAVIMNLYRNFDHEKYTFDILDYKHQGSPFENEVISYGGRIIQIPTEYRLSTLNKVKEFRFVSKLIQDNKYEVVHFHASMAYHCSLIWMLSKRFRNVRFIIHSHNSNMIPSRGNSIRYLLNYVSNYFNYLSATSMLACSREAAEWMFPNTKKIQSKVQIVNNGIQIEKFKFNETIREKKRCTLQLKDDEMAVCLVARFSEQKNHKFLIEIFKYIAAKVPSKLFLIGEGPLQIDVETQVIKSGMNDKVIFMGVRKDIPEVLQAMDVFIMPSLFEGLAVSAIEAQATGLPVLISNTVSTDVAVTSNVTFLGLNQSAEYWADQAIKLVSRYKRQDVLELIREHGFDAQESARMLEEIYQ